MSLFIHVRCFDLPRDIGWRSSAWFATGPSCAGKCPRPEANVRLKTNMFLHVFLHVVRLGHTWAHVDITICFLKSVFFLGLPRTAAASTGWCQNRQKGSLLPCRWLDRTAKSSNPAKAKVCKTLRCSCPCINRKTGWLPRISSNAGKRWLKA